MRIKVNFRPQIIEGGHYHHVLSKCVRYDKMKLVMMGKDIKIEKSIHLQVQNQKNYQLFISIKKGAYMTRQMFLQWFHEHFLFLESGNIYKQKVYHKKQYCFQTKSLHIQMKVSK